MIWTEYCQDLYDNTYNKPDSRNGTGAFEN